MYLATFYLAFFAIFKSLCVESGREISGNKLYYFIDYEYEYAYLSSIAFYHDSSTSDTFICVFIAHFEAIGD
jgi:hypothetical protein